MKREGGPGASLQEPHIESWVEDEEPAKDCEAGRGEEEKQKNMVTWKPEEESIQRTEQSVVPIYAENSSSMKTERCPLNLVFCRLPITSAKPNWGALAK